MTHLSDQLAYRVPQLRSNKHYRVGDLLLKRGVRWEQDRHTIVSSAEFDGTILVRYLNRLASKRSIFARFFKRSVPEDFDIQIFHEEVIAYAKEKAIIGGGERELVLHLRTGDAIAPDEKDWVRGQDYLIFRHQDIEQQVKEMFKISPQSIKIVTAMHFGDNEINNMYKFSERKLEINRKLISDLIERLQHILPDTEIDLYSNESLSSVECIDSDLCFLTLSKNLICDIGGFSEIVGQLRKH